MLRAKRELRWQLRGDIGQANQFEIVDLAVSEEEAYLTIQKQSRQRRKSKKEIAEAIILGDELRRGRPGS